MKKRVILGQLGWSYSDEHYLPLSAGMLAAHCNASPEFREIYEIDPWLRFARADPKEIVDGFEVAPDVLGLSIYVWCEKISLEVARLTKERWPECLIVFGGPSVSDHHYGEALLREHPYVDVLVHGEGEETFRELLIGPSWDMIPGISWLNGNGKYERGAPRPREVDLERFPSPFLDGTFDRLLRHPAAKDVRFAGVWEPDRGCPFACTYCAWGSSTASKIHTFPMERLRKEMEWIAAHEISFVYGASANFGQLPRDVEIAEMIADVRKTTGFPKKFFTNTAKNATERIFHISKILHDAGLAKGATLSPQTWSKETLVNIKRANIKPKTYVDLQKMFTDAGIPTYAEIIVGLPGETLASFCAGIDTEIEMGQHDGLAIYPCRVLPGTEMAEPEYRKVHGLVTRMTLILANHSDLGSENIGPTEYEETVIGTNTMPTADWVTAMEVSWFVQAFFCMGLARYPLLWLQETHAVKVTEFARWFLAKYRLPDVLRKERNRAAVYAKDLCTGDAFTLTHDLVKFPAIRWPIEEATWLSLMMDRSSWFGALECEALFRAFCEENHLDVTDGGGLVAVIEKNRDELIHWSTDAEFKSPAEFAKARIWHGRRGRSFLQEKA